jgi:hypothetical protein
MASVEAEAAAAAVVVETSNQRDRLQRKNR